MDPENRGRVAAELLRIWRTWGRVTDHGERTQKNHYIEETRFCIKKYKKVLTDSNRRNIMRSQQRNSNPSKEERTWM